MKLRTAALLLAGALALTGCSKVGDTGSQNYISGEGQVTFVDPVDRGDAIELAGEGLDGEPVDVADWRGQVVVVNVWGQWCGPCRSEIGQLQKVYDATKADGVAFLGIDVRDNNRDAARDFVVDRKVTFPSIYDPSMRTMIAFGGKYPTTVIPSTIVLDREHRVAAVFLRELLAQDLQPVVTRLAAEPAPKT